LIVRLKFPLFGRGIIQINKKNKFFSLHDQEQVTLNLTFRRKCVVIYSYNKTKKVH